MCIPPVQMIFIHLVILYAMVAPMGRVNIKFNRNIYNNLSLRLNITIITNLHHPVVWEDKRQCWLLVCHLCPRHYPNRSVILRTGLGTPRNQRVENLVVLTYHCMK